MEIEGFKKVKGYRPICYAVHGAQGFDQMHPLKEPGVYRTREDADLILREGTKNLPRHIGYFSSVDVVNCFQDGNGNLYEIRHLGEFAPTPS